MYFGKRKINKDYKLQQYYMISSKKTIFGFLIILFIALNNFVWAQSDSLLYREIDMKRIGVNYFNFSKLDKFNFEVVVLGGVKNPGIYLLSEGTTMVELMALIGGAIDESIFDNFKLIRAKIKNPDLKADTVLVLSYKDFFDKDKTGSITKKNPLLRPGDIIAFPVKPDKDFWDYATRVSTIFILPLISIATLIVTILNYSK